MWRRQANTSILPLVPDSSTENSASFGNCFAKFWLAEEWSCYADSINTRKDHDGKFIVTKELEKFLLPYKNIINVPSNSTGFRMFFSFITQISPKNSSTVNKLHLSKVILLLQLLADTNLPVSDRVPNIRMLGTIFPSPGGYDILNLLFSYGLSYEKFSVDLQSFKSNSPSSNIDIQISTLKNDNDSIRIYETLRDAYSAYQNGNYSTASTRYETACALLNEFKEKKNISSVIREDYEKRFQLAKQYSNECNRLVEQKRSLKSENSRSPSCAAYLCVGYAAVRNYPDELLGLLGKNSHLKTP